MAALSKVPAGQRYVCDLLAFEAGAKIPAEWRGKGTLVALPPVTTAPTGGTLTWQQQKAAKQLAAGDGAFVRVLDDLVEALLAKRVLTLSDLPPLLRRSSASAVLNGRSWKAGKHRRRHSHDRNQNKDQV